ncbi:heat-inducible transcriptional repressor HrcA [Thermomicrobiaceae bacterium CFH 74404]|uniref:Heat-inducible transcription repressor HrcA n=2 Tax=Thermomicrobia TaxID=189775 RepID=A0AA42BAG7_9BACT|nr:heat-inducible transcriptional repressor HrcA [Thermalbibacter longus]MCM8748559.1 heat-inducible transcriptional repressor HrcA [Thermalbibacter longus]
MELTERQQSILKYVVEEYIRTGRAIGSKALLDRFPLGVSSATVRNEMGVLETLDYLQQPHTSAGRVPTERGLRYYVEHLMQTDELSPAEQLMISHQFRQVEQQVASWLKLAAAVLANASGNVGLVTPPRSRVERLRHFELINLRGRLALLVLVTQSSAIHQSLLEFSEPVDQTTLSALSQRLNPEIRWLDREQIERKARGASPLVASVLRWIAEALHYLERQQRSELYAEGLDQVIRQPEFARGDMAYALLELLRGGMILSVLLPQLEPGDEVRVLIGSDLHLRELRPFSVVVSAYRAGDESSGLLGVLGPQRMAYARSISMVRYLAHVVSRLMGELYGEDENIGADDAVKGMLN